MNAALGDSDGICHPTNSGNSTKTLIRRPKYTKDDHKLLSLVLLISKQILQFPTILKNKVPSWKKVNITSLFHTQGKESSLTIISLTITTFAERMRTWWGCSCVSISCPCSDLRVRGHSGARYTIMLFQNSCLWPWLSYIVMRFLLCYCNQMSPMYVWGPPFKYGRTTGSKSIRKIFLSYFSRSEQPSQWSIICKVRVLSPSSKDCLGEWWHGAKYRHGRHQKGKD